MRWFLSVYKDDRLCKYLSVGGKSTAPGLAPVVRYKVDYRTGFPMIDSSGRRALSANGTILDLLPVGKAIAFSGVLLVILFTLVKPAASHGLNMGGRLLFWSLHVGLGLCAIWIASWWLGTRARLPVGTWASVLVTGCGGVLIAAAGYIVLDVIYAPYIVDLDPDPPAGPLFFGLLTEIVELAPWFMLSWVLINLPVLLPRPSPTVQLDDAVDHNVQDESVIPETDRSDEDSGLMRAELPQPARNPGSTSDNTAGPDHSGKSAEQSQRFLLNLPGVMGTDVIAVSSDLHYLNVWTVAGRTTVLGNLRDVVVELGPSGMQVHRSHWVAHSHVRRIVGTATDAACILSNELRIPISRRKWKSVREQYGRGVVNTDIER